MSDDISRAKNYIFGEYNNQFNIILPYDGARKAKGSINDKVILNHKCKYIMLSGTLFKRF